MGLSWPSSLPMPLLDGYSTTPGIEVVRTDMESGEARTRRRSASAPDVIKLSWLLDAAQMKQFRAYWDAELAAGAAWCDMSIDVGDGIEQKSVRVIGQYTASKVSAGYWRVSCEAEVRKLRSTAFDYLNLMGLPSLDLNFAATQSLDPVITSSRQPHPVVSFARGSTATYIGADGLLKIAADNEPRFDFDPVTLVCKGLLIEEGRTNFALYSEQFDNSAWIKTNVLAFGTGSVANSTLAPDGTMTADKVVENTTASVAHYVHIARTGSNETVTFSCFVKAAERNKVEIKASNFATHSLGAMFDLSAGTVIGIDPANADYSSPVAGISPVGNGWYRLFLTITKGAVNTTNNLRIGPCDAAGNNSYTGDGVSGIYLWGAQGEVGSFPTSYIPTTNSAVSRAQEFADIFGAGFYSWYRPDQGSLIVERIHGAYPLPVEYDSVHLWDSSANNRISSRVVGGVARYCDARVVTGGIDQVDSADTITLAGIGHKHGIAFAQNDFQSFVDGANSYSDTSITLPVVTRLTIYPLGAGCFRRLRFFPKRLPNATLQALTA